MNLLKRGMVVVVFSLGFIGLSGCSEDNETEAQKLSKNMGDPGKPSETAKPALPTNLPPPRSQKEFMERQPDPGKQMGTSYPGAEKKGK